MAIIHTTKLPLITRDSARCAEKAVSYDKRIGGAGRIDRRIVGRIRVSVPCHQVGTSDRLCWE